MSATEKITLGGTAYDAAPLTIRQLKDALPYLGAQMPVFAVKAIVELALERARPGIGVGVAEKAVLGATVEEVRAAFHVIMRLSGFVPEESPAAQPERVSAWGSIQIGNREFILGMIPTMQLQGIMDRYVSGAGLSSSERLDLYISEVSAALAPNNKDVTVEYLEHNLDIPTADKILWNIRGQIDLCLPRGRA